MPLMVMGTSGEFGIRMEPNAFSSEAELEPAGALRVGPVVILLSTTTSVVSGLDVRSGGVSGTRGTEFFWGVEFNECPEKTEG